MNCNNCGNPIAPGSTACSVCGTPVANVNNVVQPTPVQQPVPVQPVQPVQPVMQPAQPMAAQPMPVQQPMINQTQAMSAQQHPGVPGITTPNAPIGQQPVQQPVGPGFNTVAGVGAVNTPKSGGNGMVILIIILLLAALGIGGYFVYDSMADGGSRTEEKDKKDKDKDKKEEEKGETLEEKKARYKENIKFVKEVNVLNERLALLYKNDNSDAVAVDIEVEFYDANGGLLGTATDYVFAQPNKEFYVFVSKYSIGNYATYSVNIKTDGVYGFELFSVAQTELKTNDTGEKLTVQYTNTTGKKIDTLEVCIIYYNDSEIAHIECDNEYDLDINANFNTEHDYSWLKEDGLVYTRYELYANGYILIEDND